MRIFEGLPKQNSEAVFFHCHCEIAWYLVVGMVELSLFSHQRNSTGSARD